MQDKPPHKSEEVLFTMQEAAELLRCHPETLRLEVRKGNLKAGKIGRDYRVSAKRLDEYWQARGGEPLFPQDQEGKTVQVSDEHNEALEETANKKNTTVSHIVAEALQAFFAEEKRKEAEDQKSKEMMKPILKMRKNQAKVKL